MRLPGPSPHQGGDLRRYKAAGATATSCDASFAVGLSGASPISGGGLHPFGAVRAPAPHQGRALFRIGIAVPPAASGQGPLSLWICRAPRNIKVPAFLALEGLRLPPHHEGGRGRFGATGPRHIRAGVSVALELPGRPPHPGGPPSHWDCRVAHRIKLKASFTMRLPGPSPHQGGGLRRFRAAGATAASWRGLFRSWVAGSVTT